MATPKKTNDSTTAVLPAKKETMIEPVVRVYIPPASTENSDIAVDQTENVTINGVTTQIKRGEYVDVKVPVFLQLKQRYPNL